MAINNHVMCDLETLGVTPGCSILSIGAIVFYPEMGDLGPSFYRTITRASCVEAGLAEESGTLKWWSDQSPEARSAAFDDPDAIPLDHALTEFNDFLRRQPNVLLYGNGADFDNPILALAYKAAGVPLGWRPYNGRCYRTLKNLAPQTKMAKRTGTHHHALDDACNQAMHLMAIAKQLRLTLA